VENGFRLLMLINVILEGRDRKYWKKIKEETTN
jgi:hypothetical protein